MLRTGDQARQRSVLALANPPLKCKGPSVNTAHRRARRRIGFCIAYAFEYLRSQPCSRLLGWCHEQKILCASTVEQKLHRCIHQQAGFARPWSTENSVGTVVFQAFIFADQSRWQPLPCVFFLSAARSTIEHHCGLAVRTNAPGRIRWHEVHAF